MGQGEFDLIANHLRPLASDFKGALNLSDDSALVHPKAGQTLVVAKDAMVENVHFLPDDPPDTIAAKLLRTNLSDLAAMGAKPLAYLTALMLPQDISDDFLQAFASGLAKDQAQFGLSLIGGDITRTSGPLALSCTIIGEAPADAVITRASAHAGDLIWVSGSLGEAALGLRIRQGLAADEEISLELVERYRRPIPRLALGQRLRGMASAMIDVSDGLVADLGHVANASGVTAQIHVDQLPIREVVKALPGAVDAVLTGGDDYELLFTAPAQLSDQIKQLGIELSLPLTVIGRIDEATGQNATNRVAVHGPQGPIKLAKTGWRHR